jgi:hypothetical protein
VRPSTRRTLAVEQSTTQRFEAIYTGGVLRPRRELPLRNGQRVRLTWRRLTSLKGIPRLLLRP